MVGQIPNGEYAPRATSQKSLTIVDCKKLGGYLPKYFKQLLTANVQDNAYHTDFWTRTGLTAFSFSFPTPFFFSPLRKNKKLASPAVTDLTQALPTWKCLVCHFIYAST